jgi:formate dehydrogenase major subunit
MKPTAHIDGVSRELEADETILSFVNRHNGTGTIPTLCDAPQLKPHGACRVCVVEVALSSEGARKVMASCHTPAQADTYIFTTSKRLQRLRRNVVELVLTDHPLDCLTCEANNNCQLQSVAAQVGIREVRYPEGRNHQCTPKDESHPYLRTDLSKCILCYRCVRACDEIQGEFVLGVHGRGFESRIIKGLDTNFSDSPCVACGACVQACPTAAISDVYQSKAYAATPPVRTVCTYCGVGCNLNVRVEGSEVVSISAPEDADVNAGHTCVKGRYAFKFQNHPDRLRSPLIRRDGDLCPVSWEEAYDYLADRIESIREKHGPDALAGISSSRCTNEENYLMQKMMRAVVGTNNIDGCARVCHAPTAYGMQQSFGTGAATNSIKDLDHTDAVLIVGANPTSAHPVTGAKIKQKAMKGMPLIVVDPMRTELARHATHHLQLRPGTNVALLNLLARCILDAGLVDEEFVANRCEDFEDLCAGLLSLDVEELAEITGVDLDLARKAAITYATAPQAMCFHGLGVTEHSQGSQTVMLIANLVMMTGNIGKRGAGMNPLRGQNNVQGAADMGVQPHQGAGYLSVEEFQGYYSEKYDRPCPSNPGFTIPEMFAAARDGRLKALWIMGEDVAQTDPNTAKVEQALDSLELLVVQELFLSKTAERAHVVLPGASFLEKSGTFTNGERRVQRVNAAVPPLPGTKPDGQILVDMMNRLGYPQPDYNAADMLHEIADVVPFFAGIRWENLGAQGSQWPVEKDGADTKMLHAASFKRGRGRFHYFPWHKSQELEENEDRFPFVLTTGRVLTHYNCGTMSRRTPNVDLVTEDLLLVHPNDAQHKGISDGGQARLISPRGEVVLTVALSDQVDPGVLYTTFHFPESMVNRVTSDIEDEESKCPEYKVTAVDIEAVAT